MPGESAARRGRMFDLFVSQPGHEDLTKGLYFYCPLCRRPFPREATGGETPALTLAHIIPESLGGTWNTLTCAECNNDNGRKIEADLLSQNKFTDWVHGVGCLNVRMGDDRRVRAECKRDPEFKKLTFNVTTPMASPAVRAHQSTIRSAQAGQEFHVTVPWFRPGWCGAAICQSAYLLMFRWFGYDFARNPRYNFLREHVVNPNLEWTGHIFDLPPEISSQLLEGNQAAVVFTQSPSRAILAVIRLRSPGGREQVVAIAMPGPDEEPVISMGLEGLVYSPVAESPEAMAGQQGAFWLAWHQWLGA